MFERLFPRLMCAVFFVFIISSCAEKDSERGALHIDNILACPDGSYLVAARTIQAPKGYVICLSADSGERTVLACSQSGGKFQLWPGSSMAFSVFAEHASSGLPQDVRFFAWIGETHELKSIKQLTPWYPPCVIDSQRNRIYVDNCEDESCNRMILSSCTLEDGALVQNEHCYVDSGEPVAAMSFASCILGQRSEYILFCGRSPEKSGDETHMFLLSRFPLGLICETVCAGRIMTLRPSPNAAEAYGISCVETEHGMSEDVFRCSIIATGTETAEVKVTVLKQVLLNEEHNIDIASGLLAICTPDTIHVERFKPSVSDVNEERISGEDAWESLGVISGRFENVRVRASGDGLVAWCEGTMLKADIVGDGVVVRGMSELTM